MSPLAKVGVLPGSAVLLDVSVLLDSAALGIRQAEKKKTQRDCPLTQWQVEAEMRGKSSRKQVK